MRAVIESGALRLNLYCYHDWGAASKEKSDIRLSSVVATTHYTRTNCRFRSEETRPVLIPPHPVLDGWECVYASLLKGLELPWPTKRRKRSKGILQRVLTIDGERWARVQIPREEDFILKMISGSVGNLGKHRRRRLERIPRLKVDDAASACARQNCWQNQIHEAGS